MTGIILVFIAAFFWGVYTVSVKIAFKNVDSRVGFALISLYTTIGLFVLAFILAVPFAWWRLNIWLESEFVYYQEIQWMTFVYAGVLSIVIGIATISYFIIRTARGNPVDAIKYE